MSERIEKVRKFIGEKNLCETQTFRTRNTVGDLMETIYASDGIIIDFCEGWDYLEIFGLTDEEYRSLSDILDLYGI